MRSLYRLISGRDANKDQSYFLCQLNQFQLSKALFPIGDMEKSEVRRLAEAGGLVTAGKKDSQGLCFIGHVSLPDFLQQKLSTKEGDVVEIERDAPAVLAHKERVLRGDAVENPSLWHAHFNRNDGKVIAKHNGAHFYTRGQRRGLQIGGKPLPLFVLQTDVEENVIYVGQGDNHWGLISSGLFVHEEEAHWVRPSLKEAVLETHELKCRFRNRQALVGCKLLVIEGGYQVVFGAPDKAVTAGQFVAIYWNDEIVFSGAIA